jgi:hypothetical protein
MESSCGYIDIEIDIEQDPSNPTTIKFIGLNGN